MGQKPKLAVWKFTSCDGCQLSLLDCEDELLAVADAVEIAYFPEATRRVVDGPYNVSLVEGSVSTPEEAERIRHIREISGVVVAIGACATAGGIQALRNFADVAEMARCVYAHPEVLETLATCTPMDQHVTVDYELRGCPIGKDQLLELLNALLNGRKPVLPTHSVCVECKLRDTPCVLVSHGTPCLGPVTQAGCHALCPSFARGCFGCFGPMESPNTASMARVLAVAGASPGEIARAFRTFTAGAEAFRAEGEIHDRN